MSARIALPAWALCLLVLGGCATRPQPYDYTEFTKAKPVTLLVLPPVNDSPDVKATAAVWSHAALPLAEAGYYVLPVTLVDETLRQNGVDSPTAAQSIAYDKLRDYFGADAAVYIKVKRYGSSYTVLVSETVVQAEARIVDLRTGTLLWEGTAQASSAEGQQSQGSLIALLVVAVVQQIMSTATDASYGYAAIASSRLLGNPRFNGVLAGPRSPNYGKVPANP
jgi:hypothetical protein